MNLANSYQNTLGTYLEQVYKSHPAPTDFINISSHHCQIPETGKLVLPKPAQTESTDKNRYFITGITIYPNQDNLALQSSHLSPTLKIICGGQTWIWGQLGLLDATKLKGLIIPLPADDVEQEIELIIQDSIPENSQNLGLRGSLNYDVVVAPNFHGSDLPCYQQIINPVPVTGIIYDGRNTILAMQPNRIARIEIYVPEYLDYQPVINCINLTIASKMNLKIRNTETPSAGTHNLVSGTAKPVNSGYKTYFVEGTRIPPDALIKLNTAPATPLGQQFSLGKIKYSIIENQVVRTKNGYIGLAF